MKSRVQILVQGWVQGVFFRATTQEVAKKLNLTGWVRNVNDDKVEILAEGEKENLEKLIDWCHQGPPSARVEKVEINWLPFKNEFDNFEIRYGH